MARGVYNPANFRGRVNYAAHRLLTLRPNRSIGSRAFDACFEMGDGDKVVAALVRRASKNPRLYNAIAYQWGGKFPEQWVRTAEKVAQGL